MFPVERTPHAKKAAQVRRTMAEMYEDPQEKQKQAEAREKYGEELRQQMVEQQAQKLRQKEALKKADEAYYQRISNQQASTSAQGKPKGDQEPSAAQVFLRRPPVPQVPSLLGQHQQRQAMQANPRLGLDRLKEYPWQVMCLPPREACARAGARPLQSEKLPSPPTHQAFLRQID